MGCQDCFCSCAPIFAITVLAAGFAYYFARNNDGSIDFPGLDQFRNENPYNATSPEEAYRWDTSFGGSGLQLKILNALDSDWHSFFDEAVADWENGSPDVLTLSTEIVEPDSECQPVRGVMKVCNGNYGRNEWRGLNTAVVSAGGYITSSIAQMNEYYLSRESRARKLYTMCHEIGHGFGLPHTDETFWNRDLGNCMDYTNNPAANMRPDTSNFEFLAVMYGEISGTSSAASTVEAKESLPPDDDQHSRWIQEAWSSIVSKFNLPQNRPTEDGDGWRLLRESPHGQIHEIDIGQGYSVRVQVLLAAGIDGEW